MMAAADMEWRTYAAADWGNAAANEHQHEIATMIKGLADLEWDLPASRRWAARRLVRMWERGGVSAFSDLSAALTNKPSGTGRPLIRTPGVP